MSLLKRYAFREQRPCWWCGGRFTAKKRDEVYCTTECGHAHRINQRRHPHVAELRLARNA